jgi:hypothetical protein
MKQKFRHFWRWFDGGPAPRRRVLVTPIVAILVIVVSLTWHVSGWPHDVVGDLCGYRGYMMTTEKAYRMIGGAVLIPNDDFYLSLPGLLAALYPLERRVGASVTFATIAFANMFASMTMGVVMRIADDQRALHAHDVGTSVLMTSAAAMLAVITRNRAVWAIVVALYGLDLALSHDLASAEHTLAIGCGVVSGFVYLRFPSSSN